MNRMGNGRFLESFWYVAAWSHEVREAQVMLFTRRILDVPVLMYRTGDGTAVAMDERCPHRRAPLSMGRLRGDEIECAYHGMRFGPDGRCTHVPGQDHVQDAASNQHFPLVERHGFLWIWMGDAAAADPDRIPDHYSVQTDRAWAGGGVMIHTHASALLIAENVLDLTHASYLHARTVGTDYVPYTLPDTRVEEDHVAVSRGFVNVKNPSTFVKIMGFEMADREQVIHFWPPGYCLLEMNVRPAGVTDSAEERRMVVLSPITPETTKSHHQFLCFYRNFELDNQKLTEVMMDEVYRTALEDTEMLEAQQRNMDDDPPDYRQVNLRVDQGPIAARRMIQKLLAEQDQKAGQEPRSVS